jgi:hypothetical protein
MGILSNISGKKAAKIFCKLDILWITILEVI